MPVEPRKMVLKRHKGLSCSPFPPSIPLSSDSFFFNTEEPWPFLQTRPWLAPLTFTCSFIWDHAHSGAPVAPLSWQWLPSVFTSLHDHMVALYNLVNGASKHTASPSTFPVWLQLSSLYTGILIYLAPPSHCIHLLRLFPLTSFLLAHSSLELW